MPEDLKLCLKYNHPITLAHKRSIANEFNEPGHSRISPPHRHLSSTGIKPRLSTTTKPSPDLLPHTPGLLSLPSRLDHRLQQSVRKRSTIITDNYHYRTKVYIISRHSLTPFPLFFPLLPFTPHPFTSQYPVVPRPAPYFALSHSLKPTKS